MIEAEDSINSLKQECSIALAAFGLSIDEQEKDATSGAVDLLVLKQDPESNVLRIRCLEEGVSKLFIVKYRSAQDKLVSFALTAKVEKLLTIEHSVLAWTEPQAAQPLIPRRKRTSSGQAFWLNDQPGKETQEKCCWSVSEYLTNGPSFNWLEDPPPWSVAHARAAGELLAKLHCAGRLAKEKLTGAEAHQLSSLLPSLPQLLSTALKAGPSAHFSNEQIVAIENELSRAVAVLTTGPNAAVLAQEELIVHGDFHPGNMLFADTAAVAAIDLDFAHLEHPLYDLAYAQLMFAPTTGTADRAVSLHAGYCEHFDRTAQEPPSFLPTASQIASQIAAQVAAPSPGESVDTSLFEQYVIVAAALILLWTLTPAGSKNPSALFLAKRMARRISPY